MIWQAKGDFASYGACQEESAKRAQFHRIVNAERRKERYYFEYSKS